MPRCHCGCLGRHINCMGDVKVVTITNPKPFNFDNYYNASDLSDMKLQILSETGEILGILKTHRIILNQNKVLGKLLENKTAIMGDFDAIRTFVNYLYTHKVEKDKLNLQLLKVAKKCDDPFLENACITQILEELKSLTPNELINEFLGALRNKMYFIATSAAELIMAQYSKIKHEKEFAKIMENKEATAMIFDALKSDNEQMKKRLSATKLRFELELSWTEKVEYTFVESTSRWKFEVFRGIEDNEDWLYFDYTKIGNDTLMMEDFFVTLLPNPTQGSNFDAKEKTCEANRFSKTKFLSWTFVMDPKNGYINKGTIKVEIEYNYQYRAARKSSGGNPPRVTLASKRRRV